MKNYLYFTEKWGAKIWSECDVKDIRPLPEGQPDGARYEVVYRSTTAWLYKPLKKVRARNVVVSAGALGTQRLLFRCREITRSLPRLSQKLGSMVRTNNEALLGSSARDNQVDYSEGIAITSIFYADPVTTVEPVRYPAGSSLMRFLTGPLLEMDGSIPKRFMITLSRMFSRPVDFLKTHVMPGWAQRTTILLEMQTEDNQHPYAPGPQPAEHRFVGRTRKAHGQPWGLLLSIRVLRFMRHGCIMLHHFDALQAFLNTSRTVFVNSATLRRAVDSAALAAATKYRLNVAEVDMEKIALEYLRLNGVNDPTAVVTTCESEPGLCPSGEERKLVHVVASTSVATTFISVLGFSTIDLTAEAVSEAASLDVILVLDTSESMTFDEDKANAAMHGGLDFRDPQICNADDPTGADGFPGECHPFEEVKAAAVEFVNQLYFPYDRVGIVTFDRWAYPMQYDPIRSKWISRPNQQQIRS